jgi:hypothetical protein
LGSFLGSFAGSFGNRSGALLGIVSGIFRGIFRGSFWGSSWDRFWDLPQDLSGIFPRGSFFEKHEDRIGMPAGSALESFSDKTEQKKSENKKEGKN